MNMIFSTDLICFSTSLEGKMPIFANKYLEKEACSCLSVAS